MRTRGRSYEFRPDWHYDKPPRGRAQVGAQHGAALGATMSWLFMVLCIAFTVGVCGKVVLKSVEQINQQLEQVFAGR